MLQDYDSGNCQQNLELHCPQNGAAMQKSLNQQSSNAPEHHTILFCVHVVYPVYIYLLLNKF